MFISRVRQGKHRERRGDQRGHEGQRRIAEVLHDDARQRAQFDGAPGVTLPSKRDPAAPVAVGRLAATPSSVKAASIPNESAFRTADGTPISSVRLSFASGNC